MLFVRKHAKCLSNKVIQTKVYNNNEINKNKQKRAWLKAWQSSIYLKQLYSF